jgi:chemotaxis signal transduction protein
VDAHLGPERAPAPIGAGATHLLVRAGGTVGALPLEAVRRVVRALVVHPLPGAAPEFLGLAEHAGEPLPVLDLGRLIGALPGAHPDFPVTVVVRVGDRRGADLVGLQADEALEVVALDAEAILVSGRGFVAGEIAHGETALRVLDPAALGAGL